MKTNSVSGFGDFVATAIELRVPSLPRLLFACWVETHAFAYVCRIVLCCAATEYLNERLTKLMDENVSAENWLDVATGWETILSLRCEMTAERGQAILDCIPLRSTRCAVAIPCVVQLLA